MSLLAVQNLSLSFGGLKAVDDVSFSVEQGEVFAVIGPNGAGKSTLLNIISRFYHPSRGEILHDGKSLLDCDAAEIPARGIARTFQNIELFERATVLQNLLVGRQVHNTIPAWRQFVFSPDVLSAEREHRRKVEEIIDFLEITHYRDMQVSGLPYGVCKKVELARALAVEPELLLLDEPASGLNPEETEEMAFWIDDIRRDLKITVLMIEHDMSLVNEVADRVLVMANGRVLVEGQFNDVRSHPDVVRAYLGETQ